MAKTESKAFRKHFCLTAAGVTLQVLGNVLLFAATLGIMKEINAQIKTALIQELSK